MNIICVSGPSLKELLKCKVSHGYERQNPFCWEPGDQTLALEHVVNFLDVQDASSETTIPEPFTLHPEAGEEQVRPETVATPERSLEGISEPPTPVVNLSSPQPADDPSTTLLDIPEDQTTPKALEPNHMKANFHAEVRKGVGIGPRVIFRYHEDQIFGYNYSTFLQYLGS
ncbi:hypothetical protein JHK82_012217 [Glycine max]|nr:hypothetical protein JHK82_012217 [Glycine max]